MDFGSKGYSLVVLVVIVVRFVLFFILVTKLVMLYYFSISDTLTICIFNSYCMSGCDRLSFAGKRRYCIYYLLRLALTYS